MVATRRGVRVYSPSKTNPDQSSDVPVRMKQRLSLKLDISRDHIKVLSEVKEACHMSVSRCCVSGCSNFTWTPSVYS